MINQINAESLPLFKLLLQSVDLLLLPVNDAFTVFDHPDKLLSCRVACGQPLSVFPFVVRHIYSISLFKLFAVSGWAGT
jgi:hypothetical protein